MGLFLDSAKIEEVRRAVEPGFRAQDSLSLKHEGKGEGVL